MVTYLLLSVVWVDEIIRYNAMAIRCAKAIIKLLIIIEGWAANDCHLCTNTTAVARCSRHQFPSW